MAKVSLLVSTYWAGKPLKVGDEIDADAATAERWDFYGIADVIGEPVKKPAAKPK